MLLKRIIFLFFILLFPGVINGEAQEDCIFEHLSTSDGLSHGSVSVMLKDHRGFMWFATWDGINRYDGYNFKTYKLDNSASAGFASNRVKTMVEDSLGNIWIITYNSRAFRLNHLTEKFTPVPEDDTLAIATTISNIYPVAGGDVWITTSEHGLFRVAANKETNQCTISHINTKSKPSLPDDKITGIFEDSQHQIWVNTGKGILCLQVDTVKESLHCVFSNAQNKILSPTVITAFYDDTTNLYMGTDKGKLVVYNHQNSQFKIIDQGISSPVSCFAVTGNGKLYIGTSKDGVYEYNTWTGNTVSHFTQPALKQVLKMYIDTGGRLWIESMEPGISKIDIRSGNYRHYTQQLDVNPDIRQDAQCGFMEGTNNVLWMTLKGGGFGFYDPVYDEVRYFYNRPGDPESKMSNFVNGFYADPNGVLWVSTYFKGIEKITSIRKKFRFVQPARQSGFSIANEVRAMLTDSYGYLWVATKKQELFLMDSNFTVLKKIDALNGQKTGRIYAMLENSTGDIYLGTKGNGLYLLHRKGRFSFTAEHFVHDDHDSLSLSNNNIYSLLEDQQGRIWIGTYGGGINLMVDGHFLHAGNTFKNYPSVKGNKVRHMASDSKGNLWIGTTSGIIFLDPHRKYPGDYRFRLYSKELGNASGLKSNDIFWILNDHQNNIWMASLGGGLARLQNYPEGDTPLSFQVYSTADGLSSEVIFTINDDKDGNLWMSTENGIAFYNPHSNVFRNYNQYNGIMNSAFSEASCAAMPDGSLCLGANNGFYVFNPVTFKAKPQKIHISFTGFTLFGEEVSPRKHSVLKSAMPETSNITLKYNQNVIGISWAGLDYAMQKNLKYSYKLVGFDNNWQYAGNRNQAAYSKLPPGDYTFLVKFSNPELQKLNPPVSLSLLISPPFWKTIPAYLFYFLLLITLIEVSRRVAVSIIKLRNRVAIEKGLAEVKLNFFTRISHELRTPLTLILGPARELKQSQRLTEKEHSFAGLIEQNAQRLLKLVNQLLDFRKIQSNRMQLTLCETEMGSFVSMICSNFEKLADEKNIQFTESIPQQKIYAGIDREKIETVVTNLLSNAFKFTPSNGSVNVLVSNYESENQVCIEVTDSGPGVSPALGENLFEAFASYTDDNHNQQPGTGIGLALSRELTELHNGRLTYNQVPGGGARFTVRLGINLHMDERMQSVPETEASTNPEITTRKKYSTSKDQSREHASILVVDDNGELRDFLRLQLEDEFMMEEAGNGQEALEKVRDQQPDIILSDVMMPEMDGIQLLDHIKNTFETSHIPVVLLTARSSVESRIEGLEYGADAYLTKPFHNGQLKAQLRNLLNQRKLLRDVYTGNGQSNQTATAFSITRRDSAFLDQVCNIIEEHLASTEFKIEDLYTNIGMGRSTFFDKMKGLTGLSPIGFVKEYRLNKAMNLLQTGEYNVSEVSWMTGFSDAGYFSKCFREKFGQPPSQFVKLRL